MNHLFFFDHYRRLLLFNHCDLWLLRFLYYLNLLLLRCFNHFDFRLLRLLYDLDFLLFGRLDYLDLRWFYILNNLDFLLLRLMQDLKLRRLRFFNHLNFRSFLLWDFDHLHFLSLQSSDLLLRLLNLELVCIDQLLAIFYL